MRDDPKRLGDIMDPVTARLGVGSARQMGRVWSRWDEIVGPEIAAHAEPTSLRDGVLRVRVDSPAWSTELSYLAGEVRTMINRAVGSELVTEIKVWTGPGTRSAKTSTAAPVPTSREPSSSSPLEAFQRARKAWLERRSKGSRDGL